MSPLSPQRLLKQSRGIFASLMFNINFNTINEAQECFQNLEIQIPIVNSTFQAVNPSYFINGVVHTIHTYLIYFNTG